MEIKYVIDLSFGDNGKGIVTQELCRKALLEDKTPAVFRKGGPQCGHTIINDGITHVCATYGAGCLLGVPTIWNNPDSFIDPISFISEKKVLLNKGIKADIYFHENISVITPYDVAFNQQDAKTLEDGTCGKGVYASKMRDGVLPWGSLYFLDTEEHIKEYLDRTKKYYAKIKNFEYELPEDLEKRFIEAALDCYAISQFDYPFHDVEIHEGNQGLLLDPIYSPFYPHVTATRVFNPEDSKLQEADTELYFVTRTYLTRHGNGFMPRKCNGFYDLTNKFESNDYNAFQGEFKIGVLSLDLLNRTIDRFRLERFKNANLVITHMDIPVNQQKFFYEKHSFLLEGHDTITPKEISDIITSNLNMKFNKIYYTNSPKSELICL